MRKSKVMFYLITAIMAIVFIAGAVIGIRNYYHSRNNTEGTDVSDETYYVYSEDELPDSESVVENYEYVPNEKGTSKEVSAGKDDSKDDRMKDSVGTDEKEEETNDNPLGLSMHAENVTSTGCCIVFEQSGGSVTGDLQTGKWYELRMQTDDGSWVDPFTGELKAWEDIAYIIKTGDTTKIDVDWSNTYGKQGRGHYRIYKKVNDYRAPGDYDTYDLYAEFDIED